MITIFNMENQEVFEGENLEDAREFVKVQKNKYNSKKSSLVVVGCKPNDLFYGIYVSMGNQSFVKESITISLTKDKRTYLPFYVRVNGEEKVVYAHMKKSVFQHINNPQEALKKEYERVFKEEVEFIGLSKDLLDKYIKFREA